MATLRYAIYNSTTGQILTITRRSDPNSMTDITRAPGTSVSNIGELNITDESHYYIINAPVSDNVLAVRPEIGMGSDITIEGDGTTQNIAVSLPAGTRVWRNFELLGTFSGTLTWDPTSPGDNGIYLYELEPPFPNIAERFYVTVIDP